MSAQYHFIKIADKDNPDKGTWYFKPTSISDIMEHWNVFAKNAFKTGMQEHLKNLTDELSRKIPDHYRTEWGSLINQISQMREESAWKTANDIENEMLKVRLEHFNKGEEIYLSEELTVYLPIPEYITVVKEVYKDTLEYPIDFKIEDVRYIQWDGGKHWYAKIGNIDITDEYNNQKWDTKEEAKKTAEQFINNYNNG